MRRLIFGRVLPALFPVSDTDDHTEAACLTLTVVGTCYFAIHFAVAAARGLLS